MKPFAADLRDAYQGMEAQRWKLHISRFLTHLFEFYFLVVVVSLFIGFLVMFSANADFGAFLKVMNVFMITVLSIVVIGIVRKQVSQFLTKRKSIISDSPFSIWMITLLISALGLYAGYVLGTRFLGAEMSLHFMLRWGAALGSVFVFLGPYYLLKRVETRMVQQYKSILFQYALPKIKNDARYTESGFIGKQVFLDSKLYPLTSGTTQTSSTDSGEIFSYKGTDLILCPDAQFQCCYLDVIKRETVRSSGKTETKIAPLFNGYFIVMDTDKRINGETYLVPDISTALFGEVIGESFNRLGNRPGTQIAFMEDPGFEARFTVYTTDEQEARYLLSPKRVERIRMFAEQFIQPISIAFIENHIFIGIQQDADLFSPPPFGPIYEEKTVETQLSLLSAILTLPDQFDIKRDNWK